MMAVAISAFIDGEAARHRRRSDSRWQVARAAVDLTTSMFRHDSKSHDPKQKHLEACADGSGTKWTGLIAIRSSHTDIFVFDKSRVQHSSNIDTTGRSNGTGWPSVAGKSVH